MKRKGNSGGEKPWSKRIFGWGLAFALAVGLCACGEDKGGEGEAGSGVPSAVSGTNPVIGGVQSGSNVSGGNTADMGIGNANSALAKENVYRIREITLPELVDGGTVNVENAAHLDGRIYAVIKGTKRGEDPQYCIFSVDESGMDLKSAFLELPENSDSGPSGEEGSEQSGDGEDDAKAAAEPDPNIREREEIQYSDFVIGADGRTYALRRYSYSYSNTLTEQSLEERHQYVCCWDEDGRFLWQTEPCGDGSEMINVWAVFPEADGTLELLLTGDVTGRLLVRADGILSEAGMEKLSDATGKALENCRRLLRKEDGSCLLLCVDDNNGLNLMTYDPSTDILGESVGLPEDLPSTAVNVFTFAAGIDSDLIYAGKKGVFAYNTGDFRGSLKMDYVNSASIIEEARFLLDLDATHFFMFYKEDFGRELKAGIFEYRKPEDIPDQKVILLGGLNLNGDIRTRVIRYNRESERYRVVLQEYPSVEDLNLEIISGRMPDILLVKRLAYEESIPMDSYIAKGMIADVGKLIEEDGELSGTDFMPNVFEAYSVDGRLMYVVPSFIMSTMLAKASLAGDRNGWTLNRMQEVLNGMDGDTQLLDGLDRNTFMEKLLEYRGNDFIDLKTGKCAFDSPAFIEAMRFAYTLPEERRYAAEIGEDGYEMQYLKDWTLLNELRIWTFSQDVEERICYQLNGYMGGDYAFVGFPTSLGEAAGDGADAAGTDAVDTGALIRGENLMALSALSEDLKGAWDFARYYLTDEYQKSLTNSLPVNRQIFEEWALEETRRPYYTDENEEKVEYDLTLWQDGEEVIVPPLSQEQLDELIAYVESVTTIPFEDINVLNIINEELESYFSGQKKAEDTAAVIQSRVQMYVQENQ